MVVIIIINFFFTRTLIANNIARTNPVRRHDCES